MPLAPRVPLALDEGSPPPLWPPPLPPHTWPSASRSGYTSSSLYTTSAAITTSKHRIAASLASASASPAPAS